MPLISIHKDPRGQFFCHDDKDEKLKSDEELSVVGGGGGGLIQVTDWLHRVTVDATVDLHS